MDKKQTQLRMSGSTHKWITERAKANRRSMNAEINEILEAEQAKETEEKKAA